MRTISSVTRDSLMIEAENIRKELPRIEDDVEKARAKGDLSENSEYDIALNEQSMALLRLREIESTLNESIVATSSGGSEISIGSFFHLQEITEDGKPIGEKRIFMLDSVEMILNGIIGIESNLGKAILNGTSWTYTVLSKNSEIIYYDVEKVIDGEEEFKHTYGDLSEIFKIN